MATRINKYLAEYGIASRRAIDRLILEKRIRVNGVILEKPGCMIHDGDRVAVDGRELVEKKKQSVVILLNKPLDCIVTAQDTHGRNTVLDFVKTSFRVFPIGRLDKNTTGVLLLTNDGDLANTLMHPRYSVEKVYRAILNQDFTEKSKKEFESGIMLDGKKTAPCTARFFKNDRRDVMITLHEGKNRQIHRMFGVLGYQVQKLERIRYAGFEVGELRPGEWRYLTMEEVKSLRQ